MGPAVHPQTSRDASGSSWGAALRGAQPFPPLLALAPQQARVDETFGALPGALAVAALFVLGAQLVGIVQDGGILLEGRGIARLEAAAIALGVVLLFGFVEIFRRTRVTSLVFQEGRIGLYRQGRLEQIISPSQVVWYRLSIVNSVREIMLFGLLALFGVGGAMAFAPEAANDVAFFLNVAGTGLGAALALAGSVWSRWMCRHYVVPKGTGSETVALPKSALDRLNVLRF